MPTFSERLLQERHRLGLKQEELADKLGIHRVTINRYENGESVPGGANLEKLCKFFRTNASYMLGKTDERQVYSEMDLFTKIDEVLNAKPQYIKGHELTDEDLDYIKAVYAHAKTEINLYLLKAHKL